MVKRQPEVLRSHYAELKERVRAAGALLPGTPGSIVAHRIKGGSYLARAYYVGSSRRVEDYMGPASDDSLRAAMAERMEFSEWVQKRVIELRKLGFQVADRDAARVLVELHNVRLFDAGFVLVGTLAYMAHLNDLGVAVVASRTMDIDIARSSHIRVGIQLEFLPTLKATHLPFVEVPGLSPAQPATSAKLPGAGALRVDVLTSGTRIGTAVRIPELAWHAQTVPFYDYLLAGAEASAVLAGGHCVPVLVPEIGRFIWHKLYSSRNRRGQPEKARKDFQQAVTLTGAIEPDALPGLADTFKAAPAGMKRKLKPALQAFSREFGEHQPEVSEMLRQLRR